MNSQCDRRLDLVHPKTPLRVLMIVAAISGLFQLHAQSPQSTAPVVLDKVVAVVNDHAILASDLNEEMQLSVLEPREAEHFKETPEGALQRLISRTLIGQQIRDEDAQTTAPTAEDIAARISSIRKQLPACVRQNCTTDEGWKAFLDSHGLTEERAETYLRNRLQILRFIEMRFRQGIQIPQEEVDAYYHKTLLPQYQAGQTAPSLSEVAPRIEEILLQQKVNAMFSGWLDNLRKQGEVEVLDPSLEASRNPDNGGAASQ
jgi:peptidyl-prolyl cis-trans isomerase SurA